jgi:DNA-binding transcriptional LysR family regulator
MTFMQAELRDVRYFQAVVEHGSLTLAAQVLGVSQPALSHAIARLEEAFGGSLWQRLGTRRAGIKPTELGELVLSRGGRALLEMSALEKDAALLRGVQAGSLSVGAVQSLAGTLLPRWVSRFLAKYPDVRLELPLVTSETAPDLIATGKLDAALVVGNVASEPQLKRMRCGEQTLVAVVPAEHPLAQRRQLALSALASEAFVLVPKGTFFARAIEEFCRRAGFMPEVRARIASISGLCALVRAGVGVTILPSGSIPPGDQGLVEVSISKPELSRSAQLVWRADGKPTPALRAFLDVGKALLAERSEGISRRGGA